MCLHFSHTFFLLCWLDGFHPCTRPLAWLLLQLLAQKPWTGGLPGLPASPRVSGHIPPGQLPSTSFCALPPCHQPWVCHPGQGAPHPQTGVPHTTLTWAIRCCASTCVHSCASTQVFTKKTKHQPARAMMKMRRAYTRATYIQS